MAHAAVVPAANPRRVTLGLALAATLVTRIPALPVEAAQLVAKNAHSADGEKGLSGSPTSSRHLFTYVNTVR
jgi:hypothetical protein